MKNYSLYGINLISINILPGKTSSQQHQTRTELMAISRYTNGPKDLNLTFTKCPVFEGLP